ncbi:MAG: tetratricopeptide repeat protein [Chloroflexi bacterium]|nr:tetratricopeptide repeat protein [Chloroflexota bacterium]
MRIERVSIMKSGLLITVVVSFLITGLLSGACAKDEKTVKTEEHLQSAAGFVDKRDWDSAVSEYDQAIALKPDSDMAYQGRGVAYREMGDFDQAIADLTKAIELAPGRGGPYFERGVAYRLQGDPDKAISDLSRAIGNRSTTRWRGALYERGLAYKAQGNQKEAKADFEKIIQLENDRPGEADKSWAEKAQQELAALGQ